MNDCCNAKNKKRCRPVWLLSLFVMMVVPMALGKFWQPAPRTTWEWQITGTVNTSYNAQMYDVDLQDAVPSPRTYPVSAA